METVYVFELSAQRVSVGRLQKSTDRFTPLLEQTGQVWSCPTQNSVAAERRLITVLRIIARSVTEQPPYVFTHISFAETIMIARAACGDYQDLLMGPFPVSDDLSVNFPKILVDIREIYREHNDPHVLSSFVLTDTLAMSTTDLAREVHQYGIRPRTVRIGNRVVRGYRFEDVIAALDRVRFEARFVASWQADMISDQGSNQP